MGVGTWSANTRKASKPPPPPHRLRGRRAYWSANIHAMGVICAPALSVLSDRFLMDWDPARGLAPHTFLRLHHLQPTSAIAEATFVADVIATGVTARTMRMCTRDELICILPLGVAFNCVGKHRLNWDGRHVNRHLRKRPFRMETLQREVRALFQRSSHGGALRVDVSSTYHHIDMPPEASSYLGFE
jgi:hypothetical protein